MSPAESVARAGRFRSFTLSPALGALTVALGSAKRERVSYWDRSFGKVKNSSGHLPAHVRAPEAKACHPDLRNGDRCGPTVATSSYSRSVSPHTSPS